MSELPLEKRDDSVFEKIYSCLDDEDDRKNLKEIFDQIFTYNYKKRITADQILQSKFFK